MSKITKHEKKFNLKNIYHFKVIETVMPIVVSKQASNIMHLYCKYVSILKFTAFHI